MLKKCTLVDKKDVYFILHIVNTHIEDIAMGRKTKDDNLKKIRRSITIPRSLNEWSVDNKFNISKAVQVAVAEKITGMSFAEFQVMYSNEESRTFRYHPKDSIVSEFIRASRWMVEGKILRYFHVKNMGSADTIMEVQWGSETVCVRVDWDQIAFYHVLYDCVCHWDYVSMYETLIPTTNILTGTKGKLIARWLELSGIV